MLPTLFTCALLHLSLSIIPGCTAAYSQHNRTNCRHIPGDAGWPSDEAWKELNDTTGGRLIATVPLAAPCHEQGFDSLRCQYLKQQWALAPVHIQSPSSFMTPLFQTGMCSPFQSPGEACNLGNLVAYSVNATSAKHIAAALGFAKKHNIRIVIKNTGHDILGKSTGKGALGIWTHHLDFIEPILNYSSAAYTGAALRMGAGVQANAAYAAAHRLGYRVVGGTCPTVGLAGGYSLGGGHSPLTPLHGLGADNVLEWEVVTADGKQTRATPTTNADLYWALSGGGGGTYAVVVAMTARMHRDAGTVTGGALLTFSTAAAPSPDVFWAAVNVALAQTARVVDSGAYYVTSVNSAFGTATGVNASVFITAPGQSEQRVRAHLQPTVAFLDRHRVPYALNATADSSYYAHFDRFWGPLPDARYPAAEYVTSRLLPRHVVVGAGDDSFQSSSSSSPPPSARALSALARAYRHIVAEPGWIAANIGMTTPRAGSAGAPVAPNAVHPAWRSALALALIWVPYDFGAPAAMAARRERLVRVVDPALAALAGLRAPPYVNEAHVDMPDLVRASYGPHLARLRRVKAKYDADDLLYAPAGVGSDAWTPDADGRLCRA